MGDGNVYILRIEAQHFTGYPQTSVEPLSLHTADGLADLAASTYTHRKIKSKSWKNKMSDS
jgi:hypothetical protein